MILRNKAENKIDIVNHQVLHYGAAGNPCRTRVVTANLYVTGMTDNLCKFRNDRIEPFDMADTDNKILRNATYECSRLLCSKADRFSIRTGYGV